MPGASCANDPLWVVATFVSRGCIWFPLGMAFVLDRCRCTVEKHSWHKGDFSSLTTQVAEVKRPNFSVTQLIKAFFSGSRVQEF